MREEWGDGLCSSLAGQSHSAGPKSSRIFVLFNLPNTEDSEGMTRTVSAEAESSPVVCSGHKCRKAEKTPVPDEVHFQAAASQEDFYKTKG